MLLKHTGITELAEKEELIRNEAVSLFNSPELRDENRILLATLGLRLEDVIESYVHYDLDKSSYDNNVYEPMEIRLVMHIKSRSRETKPNLGQAIILELLNNMKPQSIVDMGYGSPSLYLREYSLRNKTRTHLTDLYSSANRFTETYLDIVSNDWRTFISLELLDMNTHKYPGDFECYLFRDSIEHVKDAQKYLKKIVQSSQGNSKFILSLPISKIIPMHTVEWLSDEKAFEWLTDCSLKIESFRQVFFSSSDTTGSKHHIIIVASKKTEYARS